MKEHKQPFKCSHCHRVFWRHERGLNPQGYESYLVNELCQLAKIASSAGSNARFPSGGIG